MDNLSIKPIDSKTAASVVIAHHYLHRRPPISYSYGVFDKSGLKGVVTFGVPPSRHLQKSACPTDPNKVVELNRLWLDDSLPKNSESWFVSRVLKMIPPRIVVSYADPVYRHMGIIYRALNFKYAGWTDMERKTPRFDYLPENPDTHSRDAFRNGYVTRRRRVAKIKYWTLSGNRKEQYKLRKLCPWPSLDWKAQPPPEAPEGSRIKIEPSNDNQLNILETTK